MWANRTDFRANTQAAEQMVVHCGAVLARWEPKASQIPGPKISDRDWGLGNPRTQVFGSDLFCWEVGGQL